MKKLAIALTGHRPPKLAGYDYNNIFYKRLYKKLDNIVKQALTRYDCLELHSGMALGADTIWAKVIVDNKKQIELSLLLMFLIWNNGENGLLIVTAKRFGLNLWNMLMK